MEYEWRHGMTKAMLQLTLAATLPVIFSLGFYRLEKNPGFAKLSYKKKQLVIGIAFGILAIISTETGIPVDGAVLNVRNAAPLTAGLLFGGPAGVLAGLIGGVERWFATLWGIGGFTRAACTIATIVAGFMAAVVRQFMLDNRKASWIYGLAVGVTSEVLHMLLVFITNASETQRAFLVVQKCALPMILANGLSVMAAIIAVTYVGKRKENTSEGIRNISQTFQRLLLICVVIAFLATNAFTNMFQTNLAESTAKQTLQTNIEDVKNDIRDASDETLLRLTSEMAKRLPDDISQTLLRTWSVEYDVTEINLVDENGIIRYSTDPAFVGYDMGSGEQSKEFLPLLSGTKEVVQSYQPTSFDPEVSRKYAGVALKSGGFLQAGFDAEQFQKEVDGQAIKAAKNRHVGQTGVIIICTEEGMIISDRDGHEGEVINILDAPDDKKYDEGECFIAEVHGEPSLCMYTVTEGYYIIGVLPETEAFFARDVSVHILAFMEVLVFAALFAHVYFLIKTLVVKNIQKINASLAQITNGNLNVTVDVRSNEEFASLSDDINVTVATLKHYIDEAAARIDKELEMAKKIQYSTLPSVFPPYPHRSEFSIFASMNAAKEVGGDFYDFYFLDEHHLAFLIADVSGKGIPAAMFMMTAKTLIKSFAESGLEVDKIFENANNELCVNNDAGMFVTAWMGILNTENGTVQYVNAGHNYPLIRHKDGLFEYKKTKNNFVLAGMEDIPYCMDEFTLEAGDTIFLYTDGVNEAHNEKKELYGDERLLATLNRTGNTDVENICKTVAKDIENFAGKAEQFDDITMVCLKYNGEGETC